MTGKSNKYMAPQRFNTFLRLTLGKLLLQSYHVKAENHYLLDELEPPYLVTPNHVMFWDPFIVNAYFKRPIHYVTSDMQFRTPVMRFLLSLVGAIPKSKLVPDTETIKRIVKIKAKNGIIGVFPEGRRSWDGHTLTLLYSTAKLIKALKVPVLTPILKGGYLSWPRWSRHRRRGNMVVTFTLGFTKEDVLTLTVDEIYEKLTRLLKYDESEFQQKAQIPFRSSRRAEFLERALFICPHCRSLDSLASEKHTFFCKACGYSVLFTETGFFTLVTPGRCRMDNSIPDGSSRLSGSPDGSGDTKKAPYFDTIREWNVWQLDYYSAYLKNCASENIPLGIEKNTVIYLGFRANPVTKLCKGNLVLYKNRMEFVITSGADTVIKNGFSLNNGNLTFMPSEIEGANVQNREKFEFYYKQKLFHFAFADKNACSYKWLNSVHILKGKQPDY